MLRHKKNDRHHCRCKRKCSVHCEKRSKLKVIKAVFPIHLLPNNDSTLTVLENDVDALRYTSSQGDSDVYNVENVINFYLPMDNVKDVKDIDHIDLDLHVRSDMSQEISMGMYLSQTVDLMEDGEEVRQVQQYSYLGHKYSMDAHKWTQIGERWDRPVKLGILSADNFSPDEVELSPPQLQISILGITSKVEVDNTIQLHVEYLKRK